MTSLVESMGIHKQHLNCFGVNEKQIPRKVRRPTMALLPASCEALRKMLAACERATSGRCEATSKACNRHREKLSACEKANAALMETSTPPTMAPPPPPPSPLPGSFSRVRPSCSRYHCIDIDDLGAAYSWATAEKGLKQALRFGQLGWGTPPSEEQPEPCKARRVAMPPEAPQTIVGVAAGDAHSALVDATGGLWMCGSDRWLQLGQDHAAWNKGKVWQREPCLVSALQRAGARIVQAACGADHTLALDDAGRVWAMGRGEHGQLFGESDRPFTSRPAVSAALSFSANGGSSNGVAAIWASGHCSCARPRGSELWRCIGRCPPPYA